MCECRTLAGKTLGRLWKSSPDRGRERNDVCVSGALLVAAALLCVHPKGRKKRGDEVRSEFQP